jgi:predicted small lipoprotein YifL
MRAFAALALIAALAVGLSACGQKAALKPAAGKELPVAPYGRAERLSADRLLVTPQQSAPERSVELRKRSEERADDPFDLPPAE